MSLQVVNKDAMPYIIIIINECVIKFCSIKMYDILYIHKKDLKRFLNFILTRWAKERF